MRYDRLPRGGDALIAYVLKTGEEGMRIPRAVYQDDAPPGLRDLPAVQVLRQVWVQQYWYNGDGQLRWRGPKSTRDRASRRATDQRKTGKTKADGRPDPASARVPWSIHRTEQRGASDCSVRSATIPVPVNGRVLPKRTSASTGRPAP
ncbi:hypothetical protein [Streptomyces sp. 5-6(2022)]|uniref:hypothetical protein n=1 Tax=Streptomyces sp. 5-6(2022) TaxID=2936510 RepID=UPI0023B9870F|nr:hypothetical protein [Streptomyces sp. 5-6(2022)]